MIILLGLLLNTLGGIVLHRKFENYLELHYSQIFAKLASHVGALSYDIFGSYAICILYSRFVGDRRKVPVAFERYLVIRLLSLASQIIGVVIGYMLDLEYEN